MRVKDLKFETPHLELVPVVRDFPKVFPDYLPEIPPKWEINIDIEFFPYTKPISILPYRISPSELKELKILLIDLLDKGFIKPSISPWVAPMLFFTKKDGSLGCELITVN